MFKRYGVAVLAAVLALLLTLYGSAAPRAGATPQYKYYSASGSSQPATAGVTSPVSVTLQNAASSNQPFGSAELTVPSSVVSNVTVTNGWAGSVVATSPAVILLTSTNGSAVIPGAAVTASFDVTAPTAGQTITVATAVKQSNNFSGTGNNFKNTGADPQITVVAPSSPQSYSSAAAPATIYVNVPNSVAVRLTSSTTDSESFGSAELTLDSLPSSAVGASVTTSNTGWSGSVVPNSDPAEILLSSQSGSGIQPGGSLTVSFSVTPTATGSFTIATAVDQAGTYSNTGSDFSNSGSDPTISVHSVTLTFAQGPPRTVQQSTTMCPAVVVEATDTTDGSNPAGIPVTLAVAASSADPGLYWNGPAPSTNPFVVTTATGGLATFGDCSSGLSAHNLGSDYALSASSPAASSSATSTQFAVVQYYGVCTTPAPTGGFTCSMPNVKSGKTGTTGNTNPNSSSPGYSLSGSFGVRGDLTCDGSVTTIHGDPFVTQTSKPAMGTVTMTFPKVVVNSLANNGTPLMQVCAQASEPFPTTTGESPAVGTNDYEGLLPDCPADYAAVTGTELCVLARSKNAAAETITIYVSDLSDPSFW